MKRDNINTIGVENLIKAFHNLSVTDRYMFLKGLKSDIKFYNKIIRKYEDVIIEDLNELKDVNPILRSAILLLKEKEIYPTKITKSIEMGFYTIQMF